MHKLMTILAAVLMAVSVSAAPKHYELKSPDGNLVVSIEAGDGISYSLTHGQDLLLDKANISMITVEGDVFGGVQPVKKVTRRSVSETITPVIYTKDVVKDEFNELTLKFKQFSVVFRAYDEGMAYRFISHLKGDYHVEYEMAEFNFAQDWNMWAAYVAQHTETLESQFYNSFENRYSYTPLSEWDKTRMAFLPLLVDGPNGKKIAITEADLLNYPGMYLYNDKLDGEKDSALEARFAGYPDEVRQGGHNNLQMEVQSRHPYIAKCTGEQAFPWRVISVSTEDIQMADNDMVYCLASPADPTKDWSWVKPGKVAWDWWNDWNIDGVDFRSGINNETYQYYIDFASKNGIEYVILDEGWAVNGKADLFQVVREIDLKMLVKYASERNVGLILWAGYWAFDRDMEKVCEHYSKMGIKGFKIDFMDRDDQYMVDFHRRAAEMTAKYHLLADFHGSYKPTGLHRTYPNVINFEGVHGLETMKWSGPEVDQVTYDVTVPFIRMMAGPMDYTQGAMRNATRSNYHPVYNEPMSQGTRCRQLAQYVIFNSPLNMLCDSPSNYMREEECLKFIAEIPTVWDETKGIYGRVGEFIIMARRSGDVWYVAGMNGWFKCSTEVRMDFLPEGEYHVEIFTDGPNASRIARDYMKIEADTDFPSGKMKIRNIAPGGGFVAKIVKK